MMHRAIQQFELNVQSARHLGVVHLAFADKVRAAINLDELLRAELVLAVSALDCYVHDIVRGGMVRMFSATGAEPSGFVNCSVSLGFSKRIAVAPESDRAALLEEEIRRLHGHRTFQSSDSVSQALALIGLNRIWDTIGQTLSMQAADIRRRLDVIVDRRNRIAHESDIDPTMGIGVKYPIDYPMVNDAVGLIERIVHTLHEGVIEGIEA